MGKRFGFRAAGFGLALLVAAPLAAHAGKGKGKSGKGGASSQVVTAFANTGVQPAASGILTFKGSPSESELGVSLRGLASGSSYTLEIDGVPWATLQPAANGEAEVELSSKPKKPTEPVLPGDPRGASAVIHDGSLPILTAVVSGAGESDDTQVKEQGALARTGLVPGATATWKLAIDGDEREYEVKLARVPAGVYDLAVDSVVRGTFVVAGNGKGGELAFRTPPSGAEAPLDFDPRSALVEIAGAAGVLFSGQGSAQVPGLNTCPETEGEVFLAAQPPAAGGKAKSRLRVDDDCRRDLRVEVEDVPAGSYALFVNGIQRGTIAVAFDGVSGENEGELEFDTKPDEDELLLDFQADGALIEIFRDGVLYFAGLQAPTGTGTASPGAGSGSRSGGGSCQELETRVPLISTGVFAAAKGDARFRIRKDCGRDFRVEIEKVPAGSYPLAVGGVVRGSIAVSSATGEGEIEFDATPSADEVLLDFDPRGLEVEARQGTTPVLEVDFPN